LAIPSITGFGIKKFQKSKDMLAKSPPVGENKLLRWSPTKETPMILLVSAYQDYLGGSHIYRGCCIEKRPFDINVS